MNSQCNTTFLSNDAVQNYSFQLVNCKLVKLSQHFCLARSLFGAYEANNDFFGRDEIVLQDNMKRPYIRHMIL